MKRILAVTVLALALLNGVVTTAQADNRSRHERHDNGNRHERHDNGNRHERHDDRRNDRHDRRDWDRSHDRRNWDRSHQRRDGYRSHDRRDWGRPHDFRHYYGHRFDRGRYVRPSGYYYRSWGYGDRLPRAYYGPRYIVSNYYAYRLAPPPYGYHWVRVDNDVVLAAIASGVVVSAIFGIFG